MTYKYIINEMVWDLVIAKGKFHLAKVTMIPITGIFKKTQGEPSRSEFILGPSSKWHTGTTYTPVEPPIAKALFAALKEFKTHEKRVGEKLRRDAAARAEERKRQAQLKALQNTTIQIQRKTRDGKKLYYSHITPWGLVDILQDEGWSDITYEDISTFTQIDCVGIHKFWVRIGGEGVEVTLLVEPTPGDAKRRAAEEQKAQKAKLRRAEAAAKKKAAKAEKEERERLAAVGAAKKVRKKKAAKKKAEKEEKERLAVIVEAGRKARKKKVAKKKPATKKKSTRRR